VARYNRGVSNPVTLPLKCPQCKRPVTVRFSAWTTEVPRKDQTWKCPHCHGENKAALPGKLEWVLARQDNDPPPTDVKRAESKSKT
jgi:DNA-directed RNA polymerase subunit RPC12/RpoP